MDVKLPQLGEGAESGSVVKILVKEGERIEKDQDIVELENEKAVAPIPSTASGTVKKIHVSEGDEISIGDVILTLGEEEEEGEAEEPEGVGEGEDSEGEDSEGAEGEEEEEEEEEEEAKEERKKREKPAAKARKEEEPGAIRTGAPPPASPSVRKLAREVGIDLARVRGSERGGRILRKDLKAYVRQLQEIVFKEKKSETGKREAPAPKVDFSEWGPVNRTPMSSLRKTISRRMSESWSAIPHVTQMDEADITRLMEIKKKHDSAYREKGTRITLTGLILKALIPLLKKYPLFNSSLDEDAGEIVHKEYCHIGVAVDTDEGLMAPVIRDADKKTMLEISKEIEQAAERARERKLSAGELKGGSFTISNQGGIGGGHFTPIVNRPEVAILGLGRGAFRAVVKEGKVEPGLILPVCLSYDHRVIDGAKAARFVSELTSAIEALSEDEVRIEEGKQS